MKTLPVMSRCGANLDDCRCRITGPVAVPPDEMQARHRASVERAQRSGWPVRTLAEVRSGRVAAPRREKAA